MDDEELAGGSDEDRLAEALRHAAFTELAKGPVLLAELAERLIDGPVIRQVADLDLDLDIDLDALDAPELAELLDEILLETDDVWLSRDQTLALVDGLLEGVIFTHAVSRSELERGVLDSMPDLDVIDFDVREGLPLASGGTMVRRYPFDGEPDLDEHGSLTGPDGWLGNLGTVAGGYVGVRRTNGTVDVQVVADLGNGDAEEAALRASLAPHAEAGVAFEALELLLDALTRDPTLFRAPVVPISQLFERIGLEARGAWFSPQGEDWPTPGARFFDQKRKRRERTWGFESCCEEAFVVVQAAWHAHMLGKGTIDYRPVARSLAHGRVAPAFAEDVLGDEETGSGRLASFADELAALSGKLSAPGLYLRSVNAERDGQVLDAEHAAHRATIADPDFAPALSELAHYASDRGEASRALSLLRRSADRGHHPEIEYLASLPEPVELRAGRNDPCPCGSGRKFKACCMGTAILPIEDRSGWLFHKVVAFATRPAARHRIGSLIEVVAERARAGSVEELLAPLFDAAIFLGGVIHEFIEERGVLLPADELVLAQVWMGERPKLWEVMARVPGTSIDLRDTRSGEVVTVRERTASRSVRDGQYLLGMVLPVGDARFIFGAPMQVELRLRDSLVELLDSDPDEWDVAEWLGWAFAPPSLTNREGEPTVLFQLTFRSAAPDWDVLEQALTARFGESAGDGAWTETVEIDGEPVVRCFLRRHEDELLVEANSRRRRDRIVGILTEELPTDLELVDERSRTMDELRQTMDDDAPSSPSPEVPPEATAALEEMIRARELGWLDEEIPALGGITPRQAADDPTRREDLVALLREFEGFEAAVVGGVGFSASRLRGHLGLDEVGGAG